MELESAGQVFGVGCAGGVVLELVHWYALTRDPNFGVYKRSPFYWITSIGMAVAGGLLAMLYFGDQAEGILAFHVGLSAPLILQKLVTTVALTGAKSPGPSFLGFLHW
jgi:hypothetical protein